MLVIFYIVYEYVRNVQIIITKNVFNDYLNRPKVTLSLKICKFNKLDSLDNRKYLNCKY